MKHDPPPQVDAVKAKALETILILHMDHEQNASTSTVRTAGSSQANRECFACCAMRAVLWLGFAVRCCGWGVLWCGWGVIGCVVLLMCCAVLCCAVLFCCCAVLCCAVLCCAVLCCAVLCCAVLCCDLVGYSWVHCAVLRCNNNQSKSRTGASTAASQSACEAQPSPTPLSLPPSTNTNLNLNAAFACVASGIAALWGPAHGGANEAVLKMLAVSRRSLVIFLVIY